MADILLPKEQETGADLEFWRGLLESDQPYGLLPKPPAPLAAKSRRPTVRVVVEKKYNPDQPRAPKGSPEGGQWVDDAISGADLTTPAGRQQVADATFEQAKQGLSVQRTTKIDGIDDERPLAREFFQQRAEAMAVKKRVQMTKFTPGDYGLLPNGDQMWGYRWGGDGRTFEVLVRRTAYQKQLFFGERLTPTAKSRRPTVRVVVQK